MKLEGLNITLVFDGNELGGAERQGLLLARYLKDEHHVQVSILGLGADRPGKVAQLCREFELSWQPIPFHWSETGIVSNLKNLTQLSVRLRMEKPDILLPYTWRPNVVCGLVWKLAGAKLCVWNQRDEGRSLNTGTWHRLAVRLSSCFVANAGIGKEALMDLYRLPSDRIEIIHNGIRLPKPVENRRSWRKHLDIRDDCFVACMVANLHLDKDHPTLLKAWSILLDRVKEQGPLPVLLLAGRFDERTQALKRLAEILCLDQSVRFLGAVDDIAGLFYASDICVHSSKAEGLPNAVLEAMAAGVPLVATDIPGTREAVGPDGSRFLVPPEDSELLAVQMEHFFRNGSSDPDLTSTLRRRVQEEFSPSLMCKRTASFLVRKWSELP